MRLERFIAGLTGNIASGKSKATEYFRHLGAETIDADQIGHMLYDPYDAGKDLASGDECYRKVIVMFGEGIVSDDRIDRKVLAPIVFSDRQKLDELSQLVWPYIKDESLAIFSRTKGILIYEAALLFEAGWDNICDRTITVFTDDTTRIDRLMKRNGFSYEDANKRLDSQPMTQNEKAKKSEYIIINDKDIPVGKEMTDEDPLFMQVKKTYNWLQKEFSEEKRIRP